MKKSKTVLFGLIFALTACGGGSGGGSGLTGRKVSKEEFISLAEAADKSFTVNYATIEYKTWSYGSSEQSGTQNYYYSGGTWQRSGGTSSITDFANLLNYSNLAGIINQVKSTTVYDEMDTYVEPFGVHVASGAGGNTMNVMDYQYQENGLLSYYYQSSSTEQVGKVYWQTLTVTYSFVS